MKINTNQMEQISDGIKQEIENLKETDIILQNFLFHWQEDVEHYNALMRGDNYQIEITIRLVLSLLSLQARKSSNNMTCSDILKTVISHL